MTTPDTPSLPEPDDGTTIVTVHLDGERKAWWRDDQAAQAWYAPADPRSQHWWDDDNSEPMSWEMVLKYAHTVHAVNPEPLGADDPRRTIWAAGYDLGYATAMTNAARGYTGPPAVDNPYGNVHGPKRRPVTRDDLMAARTTADPCDHAEPAACRTRNGCPTGDTTRA